MIDYIETLIIFAGLGCILYAFCWAVYKAIYLSISDYLKPRFRRNKETNEVEYYYPKHDYWWKLCGWDEKNSERNIIMHLSGNDVTIKYNGPGRNVYKSDCDMTQKEWRKHFPYKNLKQLHEEQTEYINNEDIITSKIIYERLNKNEL
jgi:hypothetical protein